MDKTEISGIVAGFVGSITVLAIWGYVGFYSNIPFDLAETIFSMLVQVNATLIGFFGIIMVYRFRVYSEMISRLQTHAVQTLEKKQLVKCDIEYETDKSKLAKLERQKGIYDENLDRFADWIKRVNFLKNDFSRFSLVASVCFVASILFSIIALTKIDETGLSTIWLFFSLSPMLISVLCIVGILGLSFPTNEEIPYH